MGKIISFVTQKGGVGKSTLLLLTSSALHHREKKSVLIIDTDPQQSIKDIRSKEESLKLKETSSKENPDYDVYEFNWYATDCVVAFQKLIAIAEKKYDYVFIDLPGRLIEKELEYVVLASDIVIIPLTASMLDINSTSKFIKGELSSYIERKIEKGYASVNVHVVINKKDSTKEYENMNKLQEELESIEWINWFESHISNSVSYRRSISTIEDYIKSDSSKSKEFEVYYNEFIEKCIKSEED